jgi:nitrate/nitrite transporter NarK
MFLSQSPTSRFLNTTELTLPIGFITMAETMNKTTRRTLLLAMLFGSIGAGFSGCAATPAQHAASCTPAK